ncbi:type II toxin-antitoxin system PemK/MazF family toxin [Marinomonas shanghaiensis]|uniref:type II toxin-antitoxin system PemK/MazF family toxin n=1 Tax=Marinomonas shanghaiensis TaxID=2202418 RepID=UPI000DB9A355|nr:type II toxin-antitoxin system PemK/MazF family toxin [Marinomonas shanghaiensis]
MRVTYILDGSSTKLGDEQYNNITEILFPDINYPKNPHTITITRMFDGYSQHRWIVKSVAHTNNDDVVIRLEPRNNDKEEIYLSKTYKVKGSVISQLRKGTLVEVDYGYIPSVKKNSGVTKSNKRYPDSRQLGEMHKRRLAIVVKATGNRIQVVPISSKVPPTGDKTCFEVDQDSTKKLINYNNRNTQSFAICSMIETVSLNRVLPPLAKPIKTNGRQEPQRSDGYPHKLCKVDLKALDQSLSSVIGISDYLNLKQQNSELYLEKNRLEKQGEALSMTLQTTEAKMKELEQKAGQLDALWHITEDLFLQFNPGRNTSEIREMILKEIDEYSAILHDT